MIRGSDHFLKFPQNFSIILSMIVTYSKDKDKCEQMENELSFLRAVFPTSPYIHANYLIPVGQNWNKESYSQYGLLQLLALVLATHEFTHLNYCLMD